MDEKVNEKVDEEVDEKVDQKVDEKVDEEVDMFYISTFSDSCWKSFLDMIKMGIHEFMTIPDCHLGSDSPQGLKPF